MKPEQYFEQSLREKYAVAKKATNTCIQTFLTNQSEPNKKQRTEEAYSAVRSLHDLLPDKHRPTWLLQLHNHLNTVRQSPFGSSALPAATAIATQLFPQMLNHDWRFADTDQSGFDFDQIFEAFREQNRIPELFDEIIGWLQQIVDSGEIDSIRAINELNNMIATLMAARQGSYFATRGTWFFFTQWMQNTGWELFGDIPVLGAAVRGLKQTLDDANTAMEKMHTEINTELATKIATDFPRLEYKPPALPAPEALEAPVTDPE